MEVHAHAHSAPAHSGTIRKKWTHYFWEFLMLFLAVFCGFLAELQLEHKIEKDREKQYMRSLVEDLKADTAMLTGNIEIRQERIKMIDTFLHLLYDTAARRQRGSDLYYLARNATPPANIYPNDGTIQQLKNSGNLRIVHEKEIAKNILSYDQKMRNALFEMSDELEMRITTREQMVKVFDMRVFIEMSKWDTIKKPGGNPAFFTNDPALINEMAGDLAYLRRIHLAQTKTSSLLFRQAENLIQLIKKGYHLPD